MGWRFARLAAFTSAVVCGASWTAAAAERVEWRLENPFPLISTEDFLDLQAAKRKHGTASMAALYEQLVRASQARKGDFLVANPLTTKLDPETGRYKAGLLLQPDERITIVATMTGDPASICEWSVDGALALVQRCSEEARLKVPAETPVVIEAKGGAATSRVDVYVRDYLIGALGDSFASGEGGPDIPAQYTPVDNELASMHPRWILDSDKLYGTPAIWWDQECHRSLTSWPVLAVLWLALSDDLQHHRYSLVSYACSGAEIGDGLLYAQLEPPGFARAGFADRDGHPQERDFRGTGRTRPMVATSQINALRRDLCGSWLLPRLTNIGAKRTRSAWVDECATSSREPDALLLAIGGNDVEFSGIVKGVLIPAEAKGAGLEHVIRRGWLSLYQWAAGVTSLDDGRKNADKLSSDYPRLIDLVAGLTGAGRQRTILVGYPNVVGTDTTGCTGKGGYDTANGRSVRDGNLALSFVLHETLPIVPQGWTAEVTETEIGEFLRTYKSISAMQAAVESKDGPHVVPFLKPTHSRFDGRLLCDQQRRPPGNTQYSANSPAGEADDPGMPPVPRFFCQKGPSDSGKQDCINLRPSQWDSRRLDRRVVNSMNDSLFTMRRWNAAGPSSGLVKESVTGSMHPIPEAHAEAADNVSPILRSILDASPRPRIKAVAP